MNRLSPRSPSFGALLLLAGLLACAGALFAASAAGAAMLAPPQAEAFIRTLSTDAREAVAGGGQSVVEREEKLRTLMDRHVAIDFLARFGLGDKWDTISETERAEYSALFRAFFLRKYAAMIGGYEGQDLSVLGARPVGKADVLVRSLISSPDGGEPLPAEWRVRSIAGRLMVIDIVVDGISVAVNQRQEFASVIASRGFSGLLDILRAQTAA